MDKDNVPDIGHLFIKDRAARPPLSGPSFVTGDAAIGVVVNRHQDSSHPMGCEFVNFRLFLSSTVKLIVARSSNVSFIHGESFDLNHYIFVN